MTFAVRQIVPAHFQVAYADAVHKDAPVDWKGGEPWRATLADAVRPLPPVVTVSGRRVTDRARPSSLNEFFRRNALPVRAIIVEAVPSPYGDRLMIDPASLENWIDARNSVPPLPFASNDLPDDIDKALDTLAEAVRRAEHGERKSMASYLARPPPSAGPRKPWRSSRRRNFWPSSIAIKPRTTSPTL